MSDQHDHIHQPASMPLQWCLDFANTVSAHTSSEPVEHLTSFEALIAWGVRANILGPAEADILRQEKTRNPDGAADALDQAITLREAIYHLLLAVADDYPPNPADLDTLNAALAEAQANRHLVYGPDGFAWAWRPGVGGYARLIGSVALSAVEVLHSDQLGRLKRCADDDCGWLFIDTTRNNSRRWCDMSDCGNRAKARRFYQRSRSSKADQ